jgi:hypothetical protein
MYGRQVMEVKYAFNLFAPVFTTPGQQAIFPGLTAEKVVYKENLGLPRLAPSFMPFMMAGASYPNA